MEGQNFFEKLFSDLKTWFIDNYGWATVVAFVFFAVVGWIVIRLVLKGIDKADKAAAGKGKSMSKLGRRFLKNVLRVILYAVYFMILLVIIGFDPGNIVTILSASGLAISLAMQKVAANFASGAIVVANKPFEEGDYVSCGGVEGTVVDIAMFSTKLLTPDNKIVVVPNSALADNAVINYSANATRRVDLTFSVAYDSDIDLVKKTLTAILDENERVLHDNGYTIRLKEHGESALVFVCRFWVNKSEYWNAYFDVTEQALLKFRAAGIEIPYNKLDVNLLR